MAHLCWAPDQTERLWRRRRRRRIDGGRGWWGRRRKASGGGGEDGGGGRRRRRYGQQPNKLLINQELPGGLSWVLHARRFDTSSGSHLWFLLVKDGARAPPLLVDAIKGTRFVSPVITLATVPERALKEWMCGFQDCRLPTQRETSYSQYPDVNNTSQIKLAKRLFLKESVLFMKITTFALLLL